MAADAVVPRFATPGSQHPVRSPGHREPTLTPWQTGTMSQETNRTAPVSSGRWIVSGSVAWLAPTTLILILAVSTAVRLVEINRSLWLDELHTSWTIAGGFQEIAPRAAAGNQAPLYFYLVGIATSVLGHSEFSLRLVSVIAGVALSLLGFLIVRRITRSAAAGCGAALLLAIDPYLIEYSQEARPYALLQLAALGQVIFFWLRFQEMENRNRISRPGPQFFPSSPTEILGPTSLGLIGLTTIGFYLHYTAILMTASLAIILFTGLALSGRGWNRQRLAPLVDLGIGMLLCWPLVPGMIGIAKRKANWELFVNDQYWTPALGFQLYVYLIPGLVAVAAGIASGRRAAARGESLPILLLFLIYLVPMLLAWTALKTGVAALYHQRYFMLGWSGIVLAGAATVWGVIGSRLIGVRVVGVLAALAMFVTSLLFNPLLKSYLTDGELPFASSWKQAVRQLDQQYGDCSLLYLFPNLIEDRSLSAGMDSEKDRIVKPAVDGTPDLQEYCLFPLTGLYRAEIPELVAKPTLVRPRFGAVDRGRMLDAGRVILMIRGDRAIVADILNEFASFGLENRLYIRQQAAEPFKIRGAPGQWISLFEFSVEDEDNRPGDQASARRERSGKDRTLAD